MIEKDNRYTRTEWFVDSRFGMFIHWGLYALPARGEWVRSIEKISVEDYQQYYDEFNPVDFDPGKWAKQARNAGMKYAVLTAKHHDGFCLFDSKFTDYKSTCTKCGRDIVREYLEAFRAEGIKVGLYYSLLDWHHHDYPHYGDKFHPMRDNKAYTNEKRDFKNYIEYYHGQVKELLTEYGKLDILWFDFSYDEMAGEKWESTHLVKMIRDIQPWIVLNNRLAADGCSRDFIQSSYAGDFASPEKMIPPNGLTNKNGRSIPWESCITLNDSWGYTAKDLHYKSPRLIIRSLVECVSKNGNFLLNVGPDAKGNIPDKSIEILKAVGAWIEKNGDSIFGCGMSSVPKPEWGRYTEKGNKLYAHVFEECVNSIAMNLSPDKIQKAVYLPDRSEIIIERPWNAAEYTELSFFAFNGGYPLPDEMDSVVEFTFKD